MCENICNLLLIGVTRVTAMRYNNTLYNWFVRRARSFAAASTAGNGQRAEVPSWVELAVARKITPILESLQLHEWRLSVGSFAEFGKQIEEACSLPKSATC